MPSQTDEIFRRLESIEARIAELKDIQPSADNGDEVLVPPKVTFDIISPDKEAFAAGFGLSPSSLLETLDLRFATWNHSWRCNVFNVCKTDYAGTVFVIRKDTGEIVRWNLIESATKKDLGLPFWSKSPYYVYAANATHISFGFGNEGGRTCHVSSCVNCFGDNGAVSWKWHSSAC